MHREILRAKNGEEVDHKNRDKLDNQKSNIWICTSRDNKVNRSKYKNNSSGYEGVSLHKLTGKYRARVQVNHHNIDLGLHDTPEDANTARLHFLNTGEVSK